MEKTIPRMEIKGLKYSTYEKLRKGQMKLAKELNKKSVTYAEYLEYIIG